MGNQQSSFTKSLIEEYNSNLTNLMMNYSSSNTSNCQTNQQITLDDLSVDGCDFNMNQMAQVVCNLEQSFSGTNSTVLSNMLQTAIDQSASSGSDSAQGFLATSVSTQNSMTDMSSYIKNVIETNVDVNLTTTCIANSTISQDMILKNASFICRPGGKKIDFSQNAQLSQFASCMTSTVVDLLKNDTKITDVISKAESKNTSKQAGLDDLMKALTGPLIIIAIVLIVFFVMKK